MLRRCSTLPINAVKLLRSFLKLRTDVTMNASTAPGSVCHCVVAYLSSSVRAYMFFVRNFELYNILTFLGHSHTTWQSKSYNPTGIFDVNICVILVRLCVLPN